MANLIANAAGEVRGKFRIPANVRSGAKSVRFVGAGGSMGQATFTGRGTITTQERRTVTTITEETRWVQSSDPIAETFILNAARQIVGVDLWFTARGATGAVIQIRETTVGFPNKTVLAEKRIKPADIITNGNSTRILFDAPCPLESGREYAFVVLCDDADLAVAVAELGKFDSNRQQWVTTQPYQVGVMLSSSNASTWTAHQDKDIAFRLLAARFTETSKTVSLGSVAVTDASDLLAMLSIDVPQTGTSAELRATTAAGVEYRLQPGQPINLPAKLSGNVALSLALNGTQNASPIIYPGIQLAAGTIAESANYVTRAFACGSNARVVVAFEGITPGTSTIGVEIENQDGTWQTLTLTNGVDVGDGWVEREYIITGFSADTTRVRITLNGNALNRPRVRKLRCVATD